MCQLAAAESAQLLSNNDAGLWKQMREESIVTQACVRQRNRRRR
jgi:hypothetical protein